ncbi:MAG: ATP-dependent Clp protease proteolytic subunit [Actinomycetota bacterium]|nr:ATP-dependent Clp protease proteolytic subunit [Actinomycetota bacterium]
MPRKKKIEKETEEEQKSSEELTEEETYQLVSLFNSAGGGSSKPRIISLYGEIDEDQCSEVSFSLLALSEMGPLYQETEKDEPRGEPIKLLISTPGGSASDMLSVYDAIRMVKPLCDVETVGLGKVMSAGVLLLAAGSKGHRKIGENCRVMIHGVAAGAGGHVSTLENELEEIKYTQEQYIKLLARETDMTVSYIKKLINRKINVYLTAAEAVELGIADEVV